MTTKKKERQTLKVKLHYKEAADLEAVILSLIDSASALTSCAAEDWELGAVTDDYILLVKDGDTDSLVKDGDEE